MKADQISALQKLGTYRGTPLNASLIETHISWVLLARTWVFKVKKPIHYPFLDFSTLEKRKHFCEKEVSLNRRLTDIYEDVTPIRANFTLGPGLSDIIDYAVRMKRLQGPKRMDQMIQNGRISAMHIYALARKIAHFHQRSQIIRRPFDLAQTQPLFNDIATILAWARGHLHRRYAKMIEDAMTLSDAFLEAFQDHMAARVEQGFVRDLHGDLHSRNIFLYRDPIIFDCIEFNDEFRQIDVLNEVAFFCMDLEAHGRWDLSSQFMKCYLERFPCMILAEDERLFLYFKFYRASARAKVNALRAMQSSSADSAAHEKEVVRYLSLMHVFAKGLTSYGPLDISRIAIHPTKPSR